jgi:hypothetical protein
VPVHQQPPPDDSWSCLLDKADTGEIVTETTRIWLGFEAALAPVVGVRGLAALYQRSLHRARENHAWIAVPFESVPAVVDLPALAAALAQRDPASAAAGACAFFQSFHDLLATLVGPSLTERLLRPAWAPPAGDKPAKESP